MEYARKICDMQKSIAPPELGMNAKWDFLMGVD